MNQSEREITCSRNDCLPHRQRAGGYTTRRWTTVLRGRMRGREVCPAPTGLQLVCRMMISFLNTLLPPLFYPNKPYQINTNTVAFHKTESETNQPAHQAAEVSFLNELQNWEGLYSSCLFTENSLLICILLFKYRKTEVGAYVFCDSGAYPALWAASVGRCVPKIPCYPVMVVLLPGPTSVNAKGAEKPRKKQKD